MARFRHIRGTFVAITLGFFSMGLSCGVRIDRTGILVNEVGVSRERIGASPPDFFMEQFLDPQHVRESGYARLKHADVVGDSTPERLVELEAAPDTPRGGVEIQTATGDVVMRVATKAWLTDFGVIHASSPDILDLVVNEYPTAMKPERRSTFSVLTIPDRRLVATWHEIPPMAYFTVGPWHGEESLFYFKAEHLTVRSPTGRLRTTLPLKYSNAFREIYVKTLDNVYTAVVGSGDGYTPYYTVCLYSAEGTLVFQEIERGRAHRLDAGNGIFEVWDRHHRWRYEVPATKQEKRP